MKYHAHAWQPIADLPDDWRSSLVDPQTAALVQAWNSRTQELKEQTLFDEFLARLKREWAIETGYIEGLYVIGEGATRTLIAKGLDEALLSHDEIGGADPGEVLAKIRDQYHAIEGLYAFVSGARPLGTSYVKELHQVLTEHQRTFTARDTLGNWVERELPRGVWKSLPNSVEHPDGTSFEYCPPEHVASEMDRLIEWHGRHAEHDVPAEIEAAWLHHRFTLIHPFTDGNGRVARCLATLVLLRAHWLPLVVTRSDRDVYVRALRAADDGDLFPLVDLIRRLQRRVLLEAMSLSKDVEQAAASRAGVLEIARAKLARKRSDAERQGLETVSLLKSDADVVLIGAERQVSDVLVPLGPENRCFAFSDEGDPVRRQWYYAQIVSCARQWGYFADLRRCCAWSALGIDAEHRTVILFSWHGIGRAAMGTGVLGCAALLFTVERRPVGLASVAAASSVAEVKPLGDEPFQFAPAEDVRNVRQRFAKWLDESLTRGLDEWQRSL